MAPRKDEKANNYAGPKVVEVFSFSTARGCKKHALISRLKWLLLFYYSFIHSVDTRDEATRQ